ncbi:tRNA (guanosine(37)-N1)-methyltransferase TrmD [Schwartzia succinivorans]|jgi:tRNA (guanine37-N1)-methyltransferase|uniref:tRNA (guanine-N(1)-)-methyltransferase n=1 Tax=Schwartzia succinivorans DSM 10502 TaxID=1123243 RepID=A0A1M5AJ57_9FIRM|nr:tRNA (guanosine(37)-N1)-methyltransferase TrmD [Schwartzia succinivorans]SHF30166.1 tRNA (guanine37-N1)-methyltransferase [Schwartzia succinivorans DSM 10502]
MRIDILTLFPAMFEGPFSESILKRSIEQGILDIHLTNFRNFAYDKHRQVDDSPFGGGSGMVLKPEPLFRAVQHVKTQSAAQKKRVVLLSPNGVTFTQNKAKELAEYEQLILICGHYEGFDARIEKNLADEAVSIGDYVLTGGELPAMVMVDTIARMLPGVLGSAESAVTDSFYESILEFPQYTRPRSFLGMDVPEVLFSGDHAKIASWRKQQALLQTVKNRPDLLENYVPDEEEKKFLSSIKR